MKRWKVLCGLALIFLSGVIVGSLGTGLYVKHSVEQLVRGDFSVARKRVMKKLSHELGLTEAQRAQVALIVDDVQKDIRKIRRKHRPEVQEVLTEGVQRIKRELTEEQQRKLDRLIERARPWWNIPPEGKEGERASP